MSDSESELGSDTGKRHAKLTDSDKDSATESDSGAETGEVQPVGVPCPPFCFLFDVRRVWHRVMAKNPLLEAVGLRSESCSTFG